MHCYDVCSCGGRVGKCDALVVDGGLTEEQLLEIAESAGPLPGGWNGQKRAMLAETTLETPPRRQKKSQVPPKTQQTKKNKRPKKPQLPPTTQQKPKKPRIVHP